MLSRSSWEPEAVLALLGGVVTCFVLGNITAVVLEQASVPGFRTELGMGIVLISTMCFHGAAIIMGTVFLRFHSQRWRDVMGNTDWKRACVMAFLTLAAASPAIVGLKLLSALFLKAIHWPVEDQAAITMILGAKPWIRVYLSFFALALAPIAEEFIFRGILFTTAIRYGWRRTGWVAVSLLFALMHGSAPIFLPLFALALALTWLRVKTDGLLAPIIAHTAFNSVNLVLLLLGEKYYNTGP